MTKTNVLLKIFIIKTLQDYSDFTLFRKYQLLASSWPKLKLGENMVGKLIQNELSV